MGWGFNIGRIACLAGIILCIFTCTYADAAAPKRVLLLLSFGRDFRPWSEYAKDLRTQLNEQSPWPLDIIEYSLVGARSNDENPEGPFAEYLRAIFVGHPPDLIIGIGAPAAGFVQRHREQVFKTTPLLLTAIEARRVDPSLLTENDAVVAVHHDFRVLFENVLQVLPDTKHIFVVNGVSPNEIFWKGEIIRETKPLYSRVQISWTENLPFEDTLKYAGALPPNSAIFYYQLLLDAAGVVHEGDASLRRLHAVANAPIFSHDESFFGRELVGGPMHSVTIGNRRAATVAIRLLGGERAADLKVPPSNFAVPKFDWRELKRWNISEKSLPAGRQILFRQPTFWEQYSWQIVGVFAAVLLQTALISWLIYEHRRRSRAEVGSRQAMAELANMNRLATAGQLSGSIAHEINQPIAGIVLKASAALRWLAVEKPDIERVRNTLSDIVSAGQRAGDIVNSVRAMFSKSEDAKTRINLNNLINTVLTLLRMDLQKEDVQVVARLDEKLPDVAGDAVQLQQVILNLIVNAIDAMRSVQVRVLTVQTSLIGGRAHVSIEDTGPGIDDANRERIFKPLYTTKSGGMGMGLSICRSIIENHGGRIWVERVTGPGSIFQFEVPAADGGAATRELAA